MSTGHITDTNAIGDRRTDRRESRCPRPRALFITISVVLAQAAAGIQTERTTREAIPIPQLGEMAVQMKSAEMKLHNLEVRSQLWVDESTDPNRPLESWQQTPVYVSSTLWLRGHSATRIRVDVQKEVLRWMKNEDTVLYSEQSATYGFDGITGRILIKKRGELGNAASMANRVVMSTERPQYLDDVWCRQYTGRYFTVYYFTLNEQGTTLSDVLSLAEDPKSLVTEYFDFTWERLHGIESLQISFKEARTQNWSKRWWLDPARGFALLRYEYVRILEDESERYRGLMEIQELEQVAEGLWWPMRATYVIEPLHQGEPYRRLRYHASEVAANDPAFDDGVFAQVD